MRAAATVVIAAAALLLSGAGGCSSGGSTAGQSASSAPVISPAPTPPPGVSLTALRQLHWTALPADPLAPRDAAISAWTGHEFLVVAGQRSSDGAAFTGADGYDPQTGRWELLPSFPLAARDSPASAWTGYGLLVWGGSSAPGSLGGLSQALGDGAILDVVHRRWQRMSPGPLPALTAPVAVTDGEDKVIILGGGRAPFSAGNSPVNRRVASYDPATRKWSSLPELPVANGHDLVDVKAVRWGSQVLVAETWQHVEHPVPGGTTGSGGVDLVLLDSKQARWSSFRVVSSAGLIGADLRPVGSLLAIGGGSSCPPFSACPAEPNEAFSVVDGQGRALSGISRPPIEFRAEAVVGDSYVVMTGSQVTCTGRDEQPGDTAAFDLTTKRWVSVPSARRFKPEPESLTWTGSQLIAMSPTGLIALGPR